MISTQELGIRPVKERDLLPIATDEQAIEYFQRKIEVVRRHVIAPIRFPHYDHNQTLLFVSGEEQNPLIGGYVDEQTAKKFSKLKIDRGHAQDLLFKAMSAYGFNSDISHPRRQYNFTDKKWEDDVVKHPSGITSEAIIFPSQTIEGLSFQRTRCFVTETGQTTEFWWKAVDKGPQLKVDVPSVFKRKPKPQISF